MKIKNRQRFGDWVVIDSNPERLDKHGHLGVLCYDAVADEISYVRNSNLLRGMSTKHQSRVGTHKVSTRVKHHELPMYVYKFNCKNSKKPFKVVTNRKPVGNFTHGYFKTIKEATDFIKKNGI